MFPPIRPDGRENPLSPEWLGPFSDASLGGETDDEFIARIESEQPWSFVCGSTGKPEMTIRCFSCECYSR